MHERYYGTSNQARAGGMKLLYEAGILRVLEGVTTFGEVRRVLSEAQ